MDRRTAIIVDGDPRYTRQPLADAWSDDAHFEAMRLVEVAACEEMDGPTPAELDAIRAATFTVEAIAERERTTDHDTAAFVDVLAELGRTGRPLDPPRPDLQRRARHRPRAAAEGGRRDHPARRARAGRRAFAAKAREHTHTLCVGRTHGIHAEPTTFGIKLAGFAFEAHRNHERLARAFAQATVGAISGAVGTYSATSPDFERRVLARLGLEGEPVSTQVVARDRHAELL